ncbi:hypothetical protein [Micromonospora sonneratiae]|uniref:Uncharacterized protein n=1 Tax=Micromonospora sonneratiae TaxID=1184706 RepID=A0ABW3YQ24_9ACTN
MIIGDLLGGCVGLGRSGGVPSVAVARSGEVPSVVVTTRAVD